MNIFRVRRCGIKFSRTCRGKGKRSTSAAPAPRSWCRANEGETLKNWGPGARMCSATPAAVPPTPQLLLRHLASSLSVLSRCQTDTQSVQQFISYHRVSYEFTVFFWGGPEMFCCENRLDLGGRRLDCLTFVLSEVC